MRKEQDTLHAEFVTLVEQSLTIPPAERLAWLEAHATVLVDVDAKRLFALATHSEMDAASLRDVTTSLVGQTCGAYRLVSRLGTGGGGQVYRGERCDGQFDQTVAIKVLTASDAASIRQFETERHILASLHHPNIAGLVGGGCNDHGLHYAIMEYVDGTALDEYLASAQVDSVDIIQMIIKLCGAVQTAHEALVIHRDIKPQNILVNAAGEPLLVDFGIARKADLGDRALHTIVGAMTPAYASPEQLRGARLTTATDVYSLGVVLYEALCGARPFSVDELSPAAHLTLLENSEVPPLGRQAASSSLNTRDLEAVLGKALAANSSERYASARALASDLSCVLQDEPVVATRPGAGDRLARFVARNRAAAAGVATAVVATVFGLGLSVWQTDLAREQTLEARDQLRKAEVVSGFLGDVLAGGAGPWASLPRHGDAQLSVSEVLSLVESSMPDALIDYPDVRIELMTRLSEAYLYLSQGERAADLMLEAIAVADARLPSDSPLRVDVRYHLGSALLDEGLYAEALEMFETTLRVSEEQGTLGNVRWIYTTTEMALAYSGLGQFKRALEVHLTAEERWLELAGTDPLPAWSEGYYSRAYFEFAQGDLESAQASLGKAQLAIELFPQQTRAARSAVSGLAGRVAYHRGEYDLARGYFDAALAAAREEWQEYGEGYPLLEAASQLAIVLCESGELVKADRLLDEIEEALPSHLEYGDGWIFHQARAELASAQGNYGAAVQYLDEARRLGRRWPHLLAHAARRQKARAVAYSGLGDVHRAGRAKEASRALYAAWLGSR